ncbi:Uncharacterized protein LOK49_LG12G00563 [Camellia lanceoleosa]|uniref:Uncharacterized protein n=1 Tax=Camellia lanceoleosa TaxID=1840588 RepID=A0ACC0FTL2_9ERIC|nr:Uncharacterized protein LOK49_LG12G00563 [Camellia lanceoleosa]
MFIRYGLRILHHTSSSLSNNHGDGGEETETLDDHSLHLIDLPLRSPTPPAITQSDTTESDHGPPDQNPFSADSDIPSKPSTSSFEYRDEEEFESLPVQHQPPETVNADSHFEGFDADDETLDDDSLHLIDLPLRSPTPPTITQSDTTESDHGPPDQNPFSADSDIPSKPSTSSFEYWDEEEIEGLPVQHQPPETVNLRC